MNATLAKPPASPYDLRIGGELSPAEFKDLKEKCQSEAQRIKTVIERTQTWRARRNEMAGNLLAFASNAPKLFAIGGGKVKREIATVMASGYVAVVFPKISYRAVTG